MVLQCEVSKSKDWIVNDLMLSADSIYLNLFYLQSYWPFHRDLCHKNEFADALEGSEPSLAMWMRNHGTFV